MHLHCFHFALTAVPSVPFHSAKRLMCFPKAAVCCDVFQTFYTELNCLTANQILISSLDHMLQHMFHRLLRNASILGFVLLLSSYQPDLYSQYMRSWSWWQVRCTTWIKYIIILEFLGKHSIAFRKQLYIWFARLRFGHTNIFWSAVGSEIKFSSHKPKTSVTAVALRNG